MDFAIPPHIQEMRDKIADFIETKVIPWEPEGFQYDEENFPQCSEDHPYIRQLQQEVKDMGLWALHLPVEAGGGGLSVLEYGLLNEIIGRSYYAPRVFGCNAPDSGNAEILWH
ncbi:MAG TPA: acyl-CoA dehydrogenase family protein, partial [Aggregatilineales bacterium]|nr:acyl-CoA dehydrogenase family protein [Aggregatilineales bacterium]